MGVAHSVVFACNMCCSLDLCSVVGLCVHLSSGRGSAMTLWRNHARMKMTRGIVEERGKRPFDESFFSFSFSATYCTGVSF